MAIDEEYPILAYLIMHSEDRSSILVFPETFRAPHLCHLALGGFTLSVGSRLVTTAVDLVTLHLIMNHPSTYLYSDNLLQWLSLMPQLENLVIIFSRPVPDHVERQLACTLIMTSAVLPNLCRSRSEVSALTWKHLSTILSHLASRTSKLGSSSKLWSSSINSRFPFRVSNSLWTQQRTSGSTVMGSSRNFLFVCNRTMESALYSCYLSCRSSHILGVAIPVMRFLRL